MTEDKSRGRGTLVTVVATAALTVAVGVTAAALGGYIVPVGDRVSPTAVAPGNADAPNTTAPTGTSVGASVVLVPVAPDVPAENPVGAEPELVLATHEARDGDEHGSRSRRDHHDEHEDEDDHDDD